MDIREQRVSENLGLVHSCAQRFKGRGIEYDDLYQAGCVGLIKAVDAFDDERGVRFSTYAVPVILGEIRRLFRDGGAVKVGRSLKELSLRAKKECAAFREREDREPKISELAEILGVETAQAAQALNASLMPISLTVDESEGGGQLDIPTDSPDDMISEHLALNQMIEKLDTRDRELITLRFFKSQTQTQTGKVLGMTQVQVSRREKTILGKLRQHLA